MADFKPAIYRALKWEGGYVNDPMDPGGETNFGVTQKSLTAFRTDWPESALPQRVKDLTETLARGFYWLEYWVPLKCRFIASQPLANLLLSMAILQGRGTAVKRLQEVLGTTEDGVMGQKTLSFIEGYSQGKLLPNFIDANRKYFRRLVAAKPAMAKFENGWLNRVNSYEVAS